jgi:1L-myo-inositol 1-phosphate cytidylyltransferase
MEKPISDAVILMAGSGSRLVASGHVLPKPLIPVAGRAVFSYTIDALKHAEIKTIHVITGRNSDALLKGLDPLIPAEIKLHPIHNPEWQKQNGLSVLAAAPHLSAPFLLTMGDHLFQPSILELLFRKANANELNVAIDRKLNFIFDPNDAMKARTCGDRVTALGKDLTDYDAIDTGLFVCPTEFFNYLERSKRDGDCSLADGVRAMASDGKVGAIDIGDAWWQDIDTPEMLAAAEKLLGG